MNVYRIPGRPSPALAEALAEFERPFTYPLGVGSTFHISHGEDYTRFFRALGREACFVAERDGRVLGTLGTAIRPLWWPDGQDGHAAYFGDLKIASAARGGRVLARLVQAAQAWLAPQVQAGFGVVMDGTRATPDTYIIECAFADISAMIGQAVVQRGWVRANELVHYARHAQIDERHAEEFFTIVEPNWNDPARRYFVQQGLELGAYVFDRLYRDLHAWGMG